MVTGGDQKRLRNGNYIDLFAVATLPGNVMDSHPAREGFFFNVYSCSGRIFFGCASVDVQTTTKIVHICPQLLSKQNDGNTS